MTHAAVYLSTSDRGARLRQLRVLVGERDERWSAPEQTSSAPDAPLPEHERDAARWLKERLATDRRTKDRIAALVIDGTGSMFAWSDIPQGVEPVAITESLKRAGSVQPDVMGIESEPVSPLAAAPEIDLPEGLTIEPLADATDTDVDAEESIRRIAIGAVPDLASRLLLDQLDAMGIETGAVMSIWHAIALAWNSPASSPDHQAGNAIVDAPAQTSTTAAVVIDADSKRLLWAWTRGHKTVACGSCRLARDGTAPDWVFARLCAEWLGWSSQLGVTPARVLVVHDPVANSVASTSADSSPPPAAVLAQHWPQCTVDAVEMDDPLLATLSRAVDRHEADPERASSEQLQSLTERPGRLQRSSRRWTSIGMIVAAIAMGFGAWRLSEAAGQAQIAGSQVRELWRDRVTVIDSRALEPGVLDPILFLEDELAARQREVAPVARRRPVMTELESIALVIGYDGVELQELNVSQLSISLRLLVDSLQEYEDLSTAFDSIAGSEVDRWTINPKESSNDKILVSFSGFWGRTGANDPNQASP